MKNVSRNKFLLCFKPVVDMDLVLETKDGIDRSRKNHALKYIAAENKYSVSEIDQCSENSENSMMIRRPSQQNLSKAIKVAVFETILAKRVRDRKILSQDSYKSSSRRFSRQKSTDSSGDDKSVNHASIDNVIDEEIKSNKVLFSQSSVGSSSSSSSSSCSTSSLSEPKRKNQNNNNNSLVKRTEKEDTMSSSWSFNYAILLLLMSLTVTILWGRVCAIFFTSIWLYFLPQQTVPGSEYEEVKKLPKRDQPRDYKKRIIMEGLLQRNHHRENALNF